MSKNLNAPELKQRLVQKIKGRAKEVLQARKFAKFSIAGASGNLVPWNQWSSNDWRNITVLIGADGKTTVMTSSTGSTYLVCGGSPSDFQKLKKGNGSRVGPFREVFAAFLGTCSGQLEVELLILEYNVQRVRIGEIILPLGGNRTCHLREETEYVLASVRIPGRGKTVITRLTLELLTSEEGSNSRYPGEDHLSSIPELRMELGELSQAINSLNSRIVMPLDEKGGISTISESSLSLLEDSALFDLDFFEATSNFSFPSNRAGMIYFLNQGMMKGLSCNPLIEFRFLPNDIQKYWLNGNIEKIVQFLRSDKETIGQLGTFFDARLAKLGNGLESSHPGGIVGWFISTSLPNEFLPISDTAIRWGDFCKAIEESCMSQRESREINACAPNEQNCFETDTRAELSKSDRIGCPEVSPLVSIILEISEDLDRGEESLLSLVMQTYQNLEILLIGEEKNSKKLMEKYSTNASKKIFRIGTTSGTINRRNEAIRVSHGSYLLFAKDGLKWEADYIAGMASVASETKSDFIYSDFTMENGASSEAVVGKREIHQLRYGNFIHLGSALIRKDLILAVGGFDSGIRFVQDYDLILRLVRNCVPRKVDLPGAINVDNREFLGKTASKLGLFELAKIQGNALVNWKQVPEGASGRVSIIIPMYEKWLMTRRAVEAVLRTSADYDLEIIIIDNGSKFQESWKLRSWFAGDPRVTIVRLPKNMNFSAGCNFGASQSSGEFLFFLNNDTEVQGDWLGSLVDTLQEPNVLGVQPLLLFPDDSIQSAGTVFPSENSVPTAFLSHLSPEYARQVRGMWFRAVTGAALLVRRRDFFEVEGFDPQFINGMEDVDLCLRLSLKREGGAFRVEPESRVTHYESKSEGRFNNVVGNRLLFLQRWGESIQDNEKENYETVGLQVTHVSPDGLEIAGPRVHLARSKECEKMRWGIKYASTGGAPGEKWGDTPFVNSLSAELEQLGFSISTYRHGANNDSIHALDDVNLVIRGLDRVSPIPGQVNILWVISHPEKVSPAEIAGFDLVFSASPAWADKMNTEYGFSIQPLLQATDGQHFNPEEPSLEKRIDVLFVGSVHEGRRRGSVEDAI